MVSFFAIVVNPSAILLLARALRITEEFGTSDLEDHPQSGINRLHRGHPQQWWDGARKKVQHNTANFRNVVNRHQNQQQQQQQHQRPGAPANIHFIPCPVMSSLYRKGKLEPGMGWLEPDARGQLTANQIRAALRKTGAGWEPAFFQAFGIAIYKESDTHQNARASTSYSFEQYFWGSDAGKLLQSMGIERPEGDKVGLNLFTMQMEADCNRTGGLPNGAGYACNANPQFQQHGYSTRLRDARYNFEKEFMNWIGRRLKTWNGQRIFDVEAFVHLMREARAAGDFSGEFSLPLNLPKYHPSVVSNDDVLLLSSWQPVFAWSAFWVAFSRQRNGGSPYFTEKDMRDFFIEGQFPDDWIPRAWDFNAVTRFFVDYLYKKGLRAGDDGLGDKWIETANTLKNKYEWQYFLDVKNIFGNAHMFNNVQVNTCQPIKPTGGNKWQQHVRCKPLGIGHFVHKVTSALRQ